ncbi:MAG: hypothetical protein K0V04_17695 [Deltaproteobacteria bacterium]|nr:hypothetical protein [Deltaproteobacteria bacterium]
MQRRAKFGLWALVSLAVGPLGCGDPCLDDGFGGIGQECNAVVSAGGTESDGQDSSGTMGDPTLDSSGDATQGGSGSGGSGGQQTFCRDADGDGFADLDDCMDADPDSPPPGHIPPGEPDCDDDDDDTFPGAAQNEDPNACMNDDDDDGWGDTDPPPGVDPGSDCDDDDDATFPGSAENEDPTACTNDDDGDGWGDPDPGPGIDPGSDCDDEDARVEECDTLWCLDTDGDGFGDPDDCEPGTAEDPPSPDHVPNDEDCDDTDNGAFPGAAANEPDICTRDADGDGWGDANPGPGIDPGSDCVDSNPEIFPGAAANEPTLCTIDADGDGWGDANASTIDPAADNGTDCDDASPVTFPGAAANEAPPLDAACTRDADGDGWGDDSPPPGVTPGTDCVDTNPDIRPGAAVGEPGLCTIDADGDGFGDANASTIDPDADNGTDCNDADANTFPGASQNEAPPLNAACTTDVDDDGFGDDTPAPGVTPGTDCDDTDPAVAVCDIWCLDGDGDGFGDPNDCVPAAAPPSPDHVMNNGDCDDGSSFTFPGAAQNEAPPLDMACMRDEDDDGFGDDNPGPGIVPGTDCVDTNVDLFPGAAAGEPGLCTIDSDGDGFGDADASTIDPDADNGTDCNDADANTFPGASQNEAPPLNAACTTDADDDGFGDDMPGPGVTPGTDCDDTDPGVAVCDIWCLDADGDGFGDPNDCMPAAMPPSPDHVMNDGDCDDGSDFTFPGAAQNEAPPLDMACMRDEDDDGFGDDNPGPGIVPGTDCVDTDAAVFPGAAASEAGLCTIDADGDGFGDADASSTIPGADDGSDCVDGNPAIFPGAAVNEPTLCTTDADGDGWGDDDASSIDPAAEDGSDCDDAVPEVAPGVAELEPELCTIDSDDDGWGDWDAPSVNPNAEEGSDCNDGDPLIERCVLLVTQDGTANAALDAPLVPILEAQGLTVLLSADTTAVAADADPTALVVISETANSGDVGANFRDVDEAVICMEGLIWDDMDMAASATAVTDTDVAIVDAAHPIAAGLVGVVDFMIIDPGSGLFFTTVAATADVVASRVGAANEVVVFAFDEGVVMDNGFAAPARRVGFGADVDGGVGANGQLDVDGITMFDAAVTYALN